MYNPSNANKWKYYIDKDKVQFQAATNFNGMNIIIYKGLKAEVKDDFLVQGVNNVPNTISETTNEEDTFIDTKEGVNARNSQGLAFVQQGKESNDKGGKGCGGPGSGQGVCDRFTTKQYGGGNADIINTNPSTKNGCYHCGKTYHTLHFLPYLNNKQRKELYLQMKKHTEDKKKAE